MDDKSCESEEEEVMGEGTGELEMQELVPEWGWRRDNGGETEQKTSYGAVRKNSGSNNILPSSV